MSKSLLLQILLFSLPFFATAQKARFEFFTTADGLASNRSFLVAQDGRGFIWVLNASKLFRYDGREFWTQPPPPAGLPGADELLVGLETYQDSLLLALSAKHIFLLNLNSGEWQPIPIKLEEGQTLVLKYQRATVPYTPIICAYNHITRECAFWRIRDKKLEHFQLEGTEPDAIFTTAVDQEGNYYHVNKGRLKKYGPSGRSLLDISVGKTWPSDLWGTNECCNDGLVFRTANALFVLEKGTDTLKPHPVNRHLKGVNITDFRLAENGDVWIINSYHQLLFYNAVKDELFDYREQLKAVFSNDNQLLQLFIDKTGALWIPTQLGLLKMTPEVALFDTYLSENGTACNGFCSFRGITEDAEGMIYASFYSGIAKINPAGKSVVSTKRGSYSVFGLTIEGNDLVFNSGHIFNPQTGQVKNIPGVIYSYDYGVFARDDTGGLWWNGDKNLWRLDKQAGGWKWQPEAQFQNTASDALHFGKKSGLFWRTAIGELASFSPKEKHVRVINTRLLEVPISIILAIEEDRDGRLWLATNLGLVQYDPASERILKHYTVQDGLPDNYICGLLTEGDSCLWLSTNKGLSRFHIPTETFINFFEEDGLTHNEFNRISYFKARDGRMFFGGLRGINAFYPKVLMENFRSTSRAAKLSLASFERLDGRSDTTISTTYFSKTPEIHLYHWDRSFTFKYVLTDFRDASSIFYSYKMDGYENVWSRPSEFNFARFSSLPSGTYVFRVRARDSKGQWHPDELSITVVVHPPWWATWWAYVLYLLAAAGVAFGIFSFLKKRWELQNQLFLEQKEAVRLKELDGFKSRLFTNLTHEFRTPLTVILGMANQLEADSRQLAVKTEEKEKLETGFRLITRNGKSLLRLINQLLDLSKLEAQSFHLHLVQGDVVPYLRYLTESFQSFANVQNLSLRFFTTLEKLEMDYDPEQIAQVMTNLISNALKFTPSGGEVRVTIGKPETGKLEISIADTGIGISEQELPHIFDRFYQVDGSHTREGEGTGIGLAHTSELVKLMGGDISVESPAYPGGKGTVFRVVLPIANNEKRGMGNEAFSIAPVEAPAHMDDLEIEDAQFSSLHAQLPSLLIIEDNPDVVTYLKTCLRGIYHLDVAFNGRIGIERALETVPDLIISDVMMPEKDGYEVCETLKNDERTSHIPIILLTAKADAASRISGLRTGADAYLTKPFDKEELLVRLEKLAELRRRMQERYSSRHLSVPLPGQAPDQEPVLDFEDAFLLKVRLEVEKELGNAGLNPIQLGRALGLSKSQFYRKMNALTGKAPAIFIRTIRLHRAMGLLRTTDLNISEIAYEVGFTDPAYFSRTFSEEFGSAPNENRGKP